MGFNEARLKASKQRDLAALDYAYMRHNPRANNRPAPVPDSNMEMTPGQYAVHKAAQRVRNVARRARSLRLTKAGF